MNRSEYDMIQEKLSKKLKPGLNNKYNNGILAAKSIIKEVYERGLKDGK